MVQWTGSEEMTREKDRAEWTPGKNRTERRDCVSTDHYDT